MGVELKSEVRKTRILHCAATRYGTVKSTRATKVGVDLAAAIARVEKLPSPDTDWRLDSMYL